MTKELAALVAKSRELKSEMMMAYGTLNAAETEAAYEANEAAIAALLVANGDE